MSDKVICTDVLGGKHEALVSDLVWRPAAYAIVIQGGAVLLSKQYGGKFALPGGGLNLGEDPEQGVVRETKEETGIDVGNPRLVGLKSSLFQITDPAYMSCHSLLIYFACDVIGGELNIQGLEADELETVEMPEWIPIDQLDSLQIASTVDYRPIVREVSSRNNN